MKKAFGVLKADKVVLALIFVIVAVTAANAGFYLLRTQPARASVLADETRLSSLESDIQRTDEQYRSYSAAWTGREQLLKFRKMLPERSQYLGIIKALYKTAKDDHMKTSSVGASVRENMPGEIVDVSFSLPVSGSYTDIRKFIYDIETSPYFINIGSLTLSGVENSNISLTIGLSTYLRTR